VLVRVLHLCLYRRQPDLAIGIIEQAFAELLEGLRRPNQRQKNSGGLGDRVSEATPSQALQQCAFRFQAPLYPLRMPIRSAVVTYCICSASSRA